MMFTLIESLPPWPNLIKFFIAAAIALPLVIFVILLPTYTLLLAVITIVRAQWQSRQPRQPRQPRQSSGKSNNTHGEGDDNADTTTPHAQDSHTSPWSHISTAFFRGNVYHIRHQPVVHAFKYPLYFCVVDLDEASDLFGSDNVLPCCSMGDTNGEWNANNEKGLLWPLSTLMMLRDEDHLKNGEGLGNKHCESDSNRPSQSTSQLHQKSLKQRVFQLVYERTKGKLDLRGEKGTDRKVLLVTHLMYYGYCFNPVSFYYILKPKQSNSPDVNGIKSDLSGDDEEVIDAIVAEVSNTPWNEMSIYVLHPDSVDVLESVVYPPTQQSQNKSTTRNESASSSDLPPVTKTITPSNNTTTYRYKFNKNFHVSPFMTMDHLYDWKFQMRQNLIWVEAKMIRTPPEEKEMNEEKNLFFTAGFRIERNQRPSANYPIQLARTIFRFPVYCFIIQLWIHYEALWLLLKGVQFIPHPEGSETWASKMIEVVMRPVFAGMEILDGWIKGGGSDGSKCKGE